MVGNRKRIPKGGKVYGAGDYRKYNKMRANIWAANGDTFVTYRQCYATLTYIKNKCNRNDNSNGKWWSMGGEVYSDSGNIRAEMWFE